MDANHLNSYGDSRQLLKNSYSNNGEIDILQMKMSVDGFYAAIRLQIRLPVFQVSGGARQGAKGSLPCCWCTDSEQRPRAAPDGAGRGSSGQLGAGQGGVGRARVGQSAPGQGGVGWGRVGQ